MHHPTNCGSSTSIRQINRQEAHLPNSPPRTNVLHGTHTADSAPTNQLTNQPTNLTTPNHRPTLVTVKQVTQLPNSPTHYVLDGAHTADSAAALAATLRQAFPDEPVVLVVAMAADKQHRCAHRVTACLLTVYLSICLSVYLSVAVSWPAKRLAGLASCDVLV